MNTELSAHYRVIEKLGEGGMGEVFLAKDLRLGRKVAIKFLLEDSALDESSKKRFLREAQTTAALDHPNICTVHEIGEDAGRSFIVMQYVEGETLARRMKRQTLSWEESLEIATQVADAMNEAHSHGIVHRDLKPQNIMLTGRGQVKVLDFGLAKMIEAEGDSAAMGSTKSLLTTPGLPVGTVPFMSPEQLRVEATDGRSDIFSLGAILFEMITGKSLFARQTPIATMSAILTFDPPSLKQVRPDVPAELEEVLRKCLDKNIENRYQSAGDLANDLKHVLQVGKTATPRVVKTFPIKHRSRFIWLIGALVALSLTLILVLSAPGNWLRRRLFFTGTSAVPSQANRTTAIKTVAALPFVTEANDAEAEFLSRGFTQNLINNLSRLPDMRVSAYSAVAGYERKTIDPQVVGRDLDIEVLVMGSFTLRGESILISAELIEARNKSHLWGRSYSRQRSDILDLQREICEDINDKLRSDLSMEKRRWAADQQTENREAYRLYLMGRNAWGLRTPEDVKRSIEFFNQAIKLDPTYALAYVGLADAYTTLGVTLPVLPPDDVMRQAKAAAQQAITHDETLADAHTSLAVVLMMYDWDWDAAEREFKRALDLNPNSSSSHNWYAYYLIAMGRFEEAEAEGERARQLDPLSLFFSSNKARTFYYAGQYEKAIEHCNKILGANPNFHNAHYLLGLNYVQKGSFKKAIEEFETVQSLVGNNPLWDAMLGYTYAREGRRLDAERVLAQLRAHDAYVPPVYFAIVYAGLGDSDQMFAWLEKAVDERSGMVVYLRIEPVFKQFHADPRFARLLERIGMVQPFNRGQKI